ncbi:MAG TPA: hypothetical protein VM940_15925, partial [Chthoniobacterales bacterium]|nr:hypothetical protein [Chthoniobacterales bacterium]
RRKAVGTALCRRNARLVECEQTKQSFGDKCVTKLPPSPGFGVLRELDNEGQLTGSSANGASQR